MNSIHPTAVISKKTELGQENEIGPYVVIEGGVKLGSGNILQAHVRLCAGTEIEDGNEVHMGANIGDSPQDLAFLNSTRSFTRIGNRNVIREYVTIHRGTKEGTATVIGDDNYLMASTHVAHNCVVGNHVILVNFASLSGYCVVEDQVFISGMVGLHQFTRVGRLAILSALSAVNKDVPPYFMVGGRPARAQGINVVGLRRAKIEASVREEIKQAYKFLYRSGLNVSQALEAMDKELHSPEVKHLVDFIRSSQRGICAARDEAVEMKEVEEL